MGFTGHRPTGDWPSQQERTVVSSWSEMLCTATAPLLDHKQHVALGVRFCKLCVAVNVSSEGTLFLQRSANGFSTDSLRLHDWSTPALGALF